ncbi:hypothetical protein P0082_01085 [Candidatus Haliotispira prima]|uniref:DUF4397 domain-containing protein n=1 Tax=Candidatus Haliotispira prima TaxID=3034016 RepID=A0ABY8MHW3_9SPIO|nr:hypothetical protein P0082_01085 [Candidatus Haliotispira prima]
MSACAPLSDSNDPPSKSTVSLAATAVVSSVQLEISSSLAITNIGSVIRLASEAAPTKKEAEASAGYVSLGITAGGTRKFSISQHYGSDFTDGLTLADVLTANTQYKLYLFFDPNTINPIAEVEGAEGVTLTNGVAALSFTTATLAPAGDAVWARSLAGEQFVGSLPEWSYSENQKGVFVAYAQLINGFTTVALSTRTADDTLKYLGTVTTGKVESDDLYLFGFSKLDGNYPDIDNYHYIIGTEKQDKISGKTFLLETVSFGPTTLLQVPLTRY